MVYYIEVGKRRTRIQLASISRCAEVRKLFQYRFGQVVSITKVVAFQMRTSKEAARAIKLLNLVL